MKTKKQEITLLKLISPETPACSINLTNKVMLGTTSSLPEPDLMYLKNQIESINGHQKQYMKIKFIPEHRIPNPHWT